MHISGERNSNNKHYATNEIIDEILSNRAEYLSQFKYELTHDEILLIASNNYNAGIKHAFDQLKKLISTSIEDYDALLSHSF